MARAQRVCGTNIFCSLGQWPRQQVEVFMRYFAASRVEHPFEKAKASATVAVEGPCRLWRITRRFRLRSHTPSSEEGRGACEGLRIVVEPTIELGVGWRVRPSKVNRRVRFPDALAHLPDVNSRLRRTGPGRGSRMNHSPDPTLSNCTSNRRQYPCLQPSLPPTTSLLFEPTRKGDRSDMAVRSVPPPSDRPYLQTPVQRCDERRSIGPSATGSKCYRKSESAAAVGSPLPRVDR